jgi:acyl-CoA reductase-like NAD-dependent aldehyde dehydrogenase
MTLQERIALLAELGYYLRTALDDDPALQTVVEQAYFENRWFTADNTRSALKAVATQMLDEQVLRQWAGRYQLSDKPHPERTVGLIMAGNIPLVGFHDWLCVFVAGQKALVKLSDKDKLLLSFLVAKLAEWRFEAWEYTEFIDPDTRMKGFDAVIATGSNNTARYFEQYFGRYPNIIRRNRNAVAVLDGSETVADLYALGRDIFAYFGLGCRNVSKLYVPRGYAFDTLLEALQAYNELSNHDKYRNNLDYNITLLLLNLVPYLNNGCVVLTENTALSSRIASLHYEYYDDVATLSDTLSGLEDQIQCLALRAGTALKLSIKTPIVSFSQTQLPGLSDYADGVDVMQFLTKL